MDISRQPGQTSAAEVSKRDLRAELLAAEQEARNKKRKAEGKPVLEVENASISEPVQDDEASKRRKLLQDALELDKDDDEDEDVKENGEKNDDDNNDEDEEYVFTVYTLSAMLYWALNVSLTGKIPTRKTRMKQRSYCAS